MWEENEISRTVKEEHFINLFNPKQFFDPVTTTGAVAADQRRCQLIQLC